MNRFVQKLLSEWRRLDLATASETIVIAVSGGADSVSLLAAIQELTIRQKLRLKIVVAHFNHNLRGADSAQDAEFVRSLAASFEFESISEIQNSNCEIHNLKDNLEQSARRARYNFLAKTAKTIGAKMVLTAHTLDDQAETFLLRLMRGSGGSGLGAMRPIRPLECQFEIHEPKFEINLVRPLLTWARREMTENYCREQKIEFRYDAMNEDLRFARVRVRRELLPFLKTFNPNIVETLVNSSDLLREDAAELDRQASEIFRQSVICSENLQRQKENNLPLLVPSCSLLTAAIRRRVLRLWLEHHRGNLRKIDLKHLRAVESLLFINKGGRTIELPGGDTVTRKQNLLFFVQKVEKSRRDI